MEKILKIKIQKFHGQKSLSKCVVCNSKKTKFIKEQEAGGLLSSLGIKTPLGKIP